MSWGTLREIKRENRDEEQRESLLPPVACPIDGERLDVRANVRNCPLGNYRWEA